MSIGAAPTRPRKMSAEPRGLMSGRSALNPKAKYFQSRNMEVTDLVEMYYEL
jgi:hypothetical protein